MSEKEGPARQEQQQKEQKLDTTKTSMTADDIIEFSRRKTDETLCHILDYGGVEKFKEATINLMKADEERLMNDTKE